MEHEQKLAGFSCPAQSPDDWRSALRGVGHSRKVITEMSFTGTVENGVIKLPADAALPDGTRVRVEAIAKPAAKNELTRCLVSIANKARNLPPDLAAEHDHYIHGTPKRAK